MDAAGYMFPSVAVEEAAWLLELPTNLRRSFTITEKTLLGLLLFKSAY